MELPEDLSLAIYRSNKLLLSISTKEAQNGSLLNSLIFVVLVIS